MIELSVTRDLVAIFGVIAGFSYYVLTVRNQNRTRQAQLFMQMYNRWNTLELRTQFDIVMNADWNDYEGFIEYSQNEECARCL